MKVTDSGRAYSGTSMRLVCREAHSRLREVMMTSPAPEGSRSVRSSGLSQPSKTISQRLYGVPRRSASSTARICSP